MTTRHSATRRRYLAISWIFRISVLLFAGAGFAQTSLSTQGPLSYTFSYSFIEVNSLPDVFAESLTSEFLPGILEPEEIVYAVWLPADKPADAPFAGMASNQVGVMIAWPTNSVPEIAALDRVLGVTSDETGAASRMFRPVYLVDGLQLPTPGGFYVHREEHYAHGDVDEAIRLSMEAWQTWEPAFGVKTVGLFREVPANPDFVNLNRIVWYPSYEVWLETRNQTVDPESARRFRERRQLLIEGSGIAIATDRALP